MELIDKEEVMKLQTYLLAEGEHEKLVMLNDVMAIQTVDAEPIRHGKWETRNEYSWYSIYCSVCGKWQTSRTKYCPNCGAKMRVEDDCN